MINFFFLLQLNIYKTQQNLPRPETFKDNPIVFTMYYQENCDKCQEILTEFQKLNLNIPIKDFKVDQTHQLPQNPSFLLYYHQEPMMYQGQANIQEIQNFIQKNTNFDINQDCLKICVFTNEQILMDVWGIKQYFKNVQWMLIEEYSIIIQKNNETIILQDEEPIGFLFENLIEWNQKLSKEAIEVARLFELPILLFQGHGERLLQGQNILFDQIFAGPIFKFWVDSDDLQQFQEILDLQKDTEFYVFFLYQNHDIDIYSYTDREISVHKLNEFMNAIKNESIQPDRQQKKQNSQINQKSLNDQFIYIFKENCNECKEITPLIEELKKFCIQYQIKFTNYNIDNNQELSQKVTFPSFGFMKKGSKQFMKYDGQIEEFEIKQAIIHVFEIDIATEYFEKQKKVMDMMNAAQEMLNDIQQLAKNQDLLNIKKEDLNDILNNKLKIENYENNQKKLEIEFETETDL